MTTTNDAGRAGPSRDSDFNGEVQRLADQGHGRNAIARQLGVSNRKVDTAADQLGIEWSREQTAKATRARLADSQAELSTVFSEAAAIAGHRLIVELQKPIPNAHLVRSLAHAAGMSADKVAHLASKIGVEERDPGTTAITVFSASLDRAYADMFGAAAQDDNNNMEESQ